MPDGSDWPRISVVTCSYNQGGFLEETLRSVLLQGYPDVEYFVMDGGSDDGSVEILRRYDPWITRWVSAPDGGQADAINKGFAHCTGDLLGWINSDDALLPEGLIHLAVGHRRDPEAILLGRVVNFSGSGEQEWEVVQRGVSYERVSQPWRYRVTWHQPGIYFPRTLWEGVGELDGSLRYVFDWDWLCRALRVAECRDVPWSVARFRYHASSKTVGEADAQLAERTLVAHRHWPDELADDSQRAAAAMEILLAEPYFTVQNRDPRSGWRHLRKALATDLRVAVWRRFWVLWLKGLVPLPVVRWLRIRLRGV